MFKGSENALLLKPSQSKKGTEESNVWHTITVLERMERLKEERL